MYGPIRSCRFRPMDCALCLLAWAAWEAEHEAELAPYWETDRETGERYLAMDSQDAGEALARSWPKVLPAVTIATSGSHGTVAVCYRHLAGDAL